MRVRSLGNTAYYASKDNCRKGDYVLVDAEHGKTLAKIVTGPLKILPGCDEKDLPFILRKASSEDMETLNKNRVLRKQAHAFCKKCIGERKLDMKLVDVEVFFDRSKIVFYFTAPTRIDFRDLVKDLVREFRAKIELRQIGVRHEIQMLGALGNCGNVCCCRGHLRKFAPVTIKMAKEQGLFLNPGKISGICGRLLCCLSYEQDNYEQFHKSSPRPGKKYQTARGVIKVLRANMFKNTVLGLTEDNQELEMSLEDWALLHPARMGHDSQQSEEDEYEDNQNFRGSFEEDEN